MWLIIASLAFGGVPFGACKAELIELVNDPLKEEKLADGSVALSRVETLAGHDASRKWVFRNGKVVEGVLLFDLQADDAKCRSLLQTALSSIESNYGAKPSLTESSNSGAR